MKNMKTTRIIFAIGLGVACLSGNQLSAKDPVPETPFAKILRGVPALELPARAAQLVKEAKADQRELTAMEVVKSSVTLNPTSTLMVVGEICRTSPKVAPVAAASAAKLQPKQAVAITKAAVSAAPSEAGKIVAAVCKEVPSESRDVAAVAVRVVPSSSRDITGAAPLALSGAPTVAMTPPRPPSVGSPFEPLTGASTNSTPNTTGNVTPGSRDYSGP